ncbi:MAG: DegT/DnrJ/EryC1/StrS aminotransferase family protein [Burkholderiaceae bacterium]|nr:DegT/DnrJ/EryC1/StrS aminotransferase family protein [Burkholderiaceae bacterium]
MRAISPDYPRPKIPTAPVLSLATFLRDKHRPAPSILNHAGARFVTSGRMAIGLALQQMKIGPGDKVLLPAYNCSSMVEPVISIGATPVFYKIRPDTSVDLDDIEAHLDGNAKALLVTHYFGFPQTLSVVRRLCDQRGVMLVEDCAHSFFGGSDTSPVGAYGDYAIASSMKFFPIFDGGCLVSTRHDIGKIPLRSAGFGFEAKAVLNTLEKGFEYGRLKAVELLLYLPMALKNLAWRKIKNTAPTKYKAFGPGASDGGFSFEPSWLDKKSSLCSRVLIALASKSRIAAKRRANYMRLQEALADLPDCRPLFAQLPEEVVPYVFPLVARDPARVFPLLKNAGVPVIRFGEFLWDGVDETLCPVSVDLSRRVMQFPCHQELKPAELDWMIGQIRHIFLMKGVA